MKENSSQEIVKPNFEEIMEQHSDAELIDILKKRKLYDDEAAAQAIREAIKRRIITKESDLQAEEFQYNPDKFKWFPKIENERARNKTKKSISRLLMVLTALPVIAGGLMIYRSEITWGSIILIFGVAWGFVSWRLWQSVNEKWIYLLGAFTALAVGWQCWQWIETPSRLFIDYFMPVVLTGLIIYGLTYLYRLHNYYPE